MKENDENKTGLKWYHFALLLLGLFGICVGPLVFTRPFLFDWKALDFSETGSIGDTIGGITAPIVGLVSILLLWWTLRAQLEFNTRQEDINEKQNMFNDASRVLSMQAHIMQIDDNIRYVYTSSSRVIEGIGYSKLFLLQKNVLLDVKITFEELMSLIEKVHILDVSVCSLVRFTNDSTLSNEEKQSTMSIALIYINKILDFYQMAEGHDIEYILPINEIGNVLINEPTAQESITKLTKQYSVQLKSAQNFCKALIQL